MSALQIQTILTNTIANGFTNFQSSNPGPNGCWATEEALRNPLILQEIFSPFPREFLLKSVSLVNKRWNTVGRTCIRDYQKCAAYQSTASACEYVSELYSRCCQTTAEGRVFPFNTLKMYGSACGSVSLDLDDPASVEEIMKSFKSQLKLKHLEIKWVWERNVVRNDWFY